MKSLLLPLILILAVLSWSGCDDEDASVLTTLNYDGANVSAPSLPPGTNVFAVYFPPAETQPYIGRTLERITFYVSEIPDATRVYVFGEGPDDRTPGSQLFFLDMTNRVNNTEWIEQRITPGIEIDGQGLWLAVEVELPAGQEFSIGCDAGRSYNSNGDLLLLSTGNEYTGFNNITGETVNWNIRGILAEE